MAAETNKYFQTAKKGEIPELKADLNSLREDKKKEAVKKVIALMTVGKDVSMLFTDVLKCITTTNLELKKLVYLYIMNYAKNNAENSILAVNTFHKDCSDTNPLVRALALRTMGCLRVDRIVEYLCEPLRHCLKDPDPYVIKTAAISVAKLYDVNPTLVENQGFLDLLKELLSHSNPSVVANAVAALCEIDEMSPERVFSINKSLLTKLITAFEDCTEWGQIFILNSLVKYTPKESREAQLICDKLAPRLQHANSAVVLSCIRVIMKLIDYYDNVEEVKKLIKKIKPSLVTLLSKENELQYVALRNINLIVQKRPNLLRNKIKVFFCKFNDPLYIKMEKLEILIMLANEKNIDSLLHEFKEYAMKVDAEFVRKAIKAIGRASIKLEASAEKCMNILMDLAKNVEVKYIVNEIVIVVKDILRRYPGQYLEVIPTLLEQRDSLTESEAKASFVWILGEYAENIDDALDILTELVQNFKDEDIQVQQQLLSSVVKLFLKKPTNAQKLIQDLLEMATTEIENPDIRDRGFIYYRLLYDHPETARQVVLTKKPVLDMDTETINNDTLNELLGLTTTLASVFHKLPSTFVSNTNQKARAKDDEEDGEDADVETVSANPPSLIDVSPISNSTPISVTVSGPVEQPFTTILNPKAEEANGLQIDGRFSNKNDKLSLDLVLSNHSVNPIGPFQIKFNKNNFNVTPTAPFPVQSVNSLQQETCSLQCAVSQTTNHTNTNLIQMALKTNFGVVFFTCELPLYVLFSTKGRLEKETYLKSWKAIEGNEYQTNLELNGRDMKTIQQVLERNNVFLVGKRTVSGEEFLYMSAKTLEGTEFLFELAFNGTSCRIAIKAVAFGLVPLVESSIKFILSQ